MRPGLSVPLAMACLLLTASAGLLLRPLTPIDETRYLAVAWEMHQSGNWLVPTRNFAIYSDKPPLLFWAINLVWLVTGVSELAARLIGPVLGCLALWLTAILGRRLWPADRGIGGDAALALAGLAVFALAASLTMFDVPLTVCVLLGLIALFDAGQEGAGLRPWAVFGAAIALGVLTKGPVILFHLLPPAILLPLWSHAPFDWRRLPRRLGFGLLVALALLALWLVPAATLGGSEYRAAILWHQSAGRLTESFAHARPWWFFLALLPVLGFPLLWAPALWRAAVTREWRSDRGLRLCLLWPGAALILFSLTSGKQIHYLVPELPALALIAARLGRGVPRFGLLPAVAVLGLGAVAAVLAAAGLLPLGRMESPLTPRTALLAWALITLSLGFFATRLRGLRGAMLLSLGGLLAVNLLIGMTGFAKVYSSHPIAEQIGPRQRGGLALLGTSYHAQFNFAARLTDPVALLADDKAVRTWIGAHPQGLLIGEIDQADMAWPPQRTILFRNRDWGIWSAAEAPNDPVKEP
ncbi:ArnT family glycosyltransferase [Paracoccus lutimaris]|uniref:4-amino-4-deoxy-L-arabinose transferase-like glycosyltransferase n=1 Tax=Paracoccus lutimaris TaxID=1490030 RepID=A0A368Z3Q6_9RHOB|nr:glycosyltransferase family 39 protein [Paracoccus lutimaris]RCW87092.1 4-amino-4-deoxy-L-arabinose transferase-like glycosyltransferase [Paracoccus lutimaris]